MPIKRNTEAVSELTGRGVSIMRGYRNGRLVFRHTAEYSPDDSYNPRNPYSTRSLKFTSDDSFVRLMNPVENVTIS